MGNSSTTEQNTGNDSIKKYFFRITAGIEGVLGALLICLFLVHFIQHSIDLRVVLALALIIIWVGVVILYLSWAIYYYNVNMGLTDDDWKDIVMARFTGNPMKEPEVNPNSDQSMGLPTGTIRAIIALTLLIAALALAIVYFGNDRSVKENEFFVDSLDFFKTAFLMMIAFYFGSKSLEFLKPPVDKSKTGLQAANDATPDNANPNPASTSQGNVPVKTTENAEG